MDSENQKITTECPAVKLISYKNTVLSDRYLDVADLIENFEVREDDVWLIGYPKSGTTWCQEMIWNIANDSNFEAAKVPLTERFPLLEQFLTPKCNKTSSDERDLNLSTTSLAYLERTLEYLKNLSNRRFIKTHLPFHLLPRQLRTNEKNAKVIYVWRNPKDVCISFYHFFNMVNIERGDFADFCKLFINDANLSIPYHPYWNHVIQYWDRRNEENFLILKYEDMKTDLRSVIKKTAHFLGNNLNDDQISQLEKHLSFSSMSANTAVHHEVEAKYFNWNTEEKFMRKGEAGQWKTEMSKEIVDQFDAWILENLKNNESLLQELS